MIVKKYMNTLAMLFAMRGTVLPRIWPQLALVTLVSLAATAAPALLWPGALPEISLAPFSLFGLVLSIFLGFRNNACYDRWWEARKQWGLLIAHARDLARQIPSFLANDPAREKRLLRRVILLRRPAFRQRQFGTFVIRPGGAGRQQAGGK